MGWLSRRENTGRWRILRVEQRDLFVDKTRIIFVGGFLGAGQRARIEILDLCCLRPGRPQPTHRYRTVAEP